ncbi:swi5-dependent recombination DNA repair protein 1 [Anaeramoeba flamelloides]|uniref:Swi5-dependent recombination DNA repair protein 1 n=1 Tax=Anaeramoeba flamelloides TaxID=1746091 RepID=A0AAV7Z732_9EUKA|nr:swi5-dependent recombination DNA repair protein 1 [Anaeramoeba flamelloides]
MAELKKRILNYVLTNNQPFSIFDLQPKFTQHSKKEINQIIVSLVSEKKLSTYTTESTQNNSSISIYWISDQEIRNGERKVQRLKKQTKSLTKGYVSPPILCTKRKRKGSFMLTKDQQQETETKKENSTENENENKNKNQKEEEEDEKEDEEEEEEEEIESHKDRLRKFIHLQRELRELQRELKDIKTNKQMKINEEDEQNLEDKCEKWKEVTQEVLYDLFKIWKQMNIKITLEKVINYFGIPHDLVGFDKNEEDFL